jgi:hypothetical protein
LALAHSEMTHRAKVADAGDTIARDTTRTVWYKKPGMDGRSGRDVGRARNAEMA